MKSLGFMVYQGTRYGSRFNNRTQADRYAFLVLGGQRVPVEILRIFEVHCYTTAPMACLVVQRFGRDPSIPKMPWDHGKDVS